MAKRNKVASNSIRNLIIHHFKDGKSIRTIGKLVKVSHSIVYVIIKRLNLHGTVENALVEFVPKRIESLISTKGYPIGNLNVSFFAYFYLHLLNFENVQLLI